MFIREKVSRGHKYYQVVEGRRLAADPVRGLPSIVRQDIVVSLGRYPTAKKALAVAKKRLAQLRREYTTIRGYFPDGATPSAYFQKRMDVLFRMEGRAEEQIERLEAVIKAGVE